MGPATRTEWVPQASTSTDHHNTLAERKKEGGNRWLSGVCAASLASLAFIPFFSSHSEPAKCAWVRARRPSTSARSVGWNGWLRPLLALAGRGSRIAARWCGGLGPPGAFASAACASQAFPFQLQRAAGGMPACQPSNQSSPLVLGPG